MNNHPFSKFDFHPVIRFEDPLPVFDFTNGYDPGKIRETKWGVGRYHERRQNMYTAPQYENRRFIHMGIDIWTPVFEPVYAPFDATVAYLENHDQKGNYGPTIVLRHEIGSHTVFALHGHLTLASLEQNSPGDKILKGTAFAEIGTHQENGLWEPHLHYQLSWHDPGEADMPGVVAEDELEKSLETYPDPRIILGPVY